MFVIRSVLILFSHLRPFDFFLDFPPEKFYALLLLLVNGNLSHLLDFIISKSNMAIEKQNPFQICTFLIKSLYTHIMK